jgi:hypothetical protein
MLAVSGAAATWAGTSRADPKAGTPGPAVTFEAGARGDLVQGLGVWRLRLKPGLYNATLRATVTLEPTDPTAAASVLCGIADFNTTGPRTRVYVADSSVQLPNNQAPTGLSGAVTMRVTSKITPALVCFSQDSGIRLYEPIAATFTPLDKRVYGVARPVSIPTRGGLAGALRSAGSSSR